MNKIKRMRMWLLVPVMLGLTGCGADDESAAQAHAATVFGEAGKHLMAVADGYVGDPDAGDLAEYQQKELAAASKQYAEIQNTGSPGQQLSAAMGLAEANAAAARQLTRQAVDTWGRLSPISKQAVPTLVAARNAWAQAEASRKLDQSAELAAAQEQLTLAQGQLQIADGRLKEQQVVIDDLTAQRNGKVQQRAALVAKADDLNRRSFEATGQMRFDLYAQAAEVTRQAEQIGVEADKLAARINVEESRKRVVEIEAAQAQDRIAGVQVVIDGFARRREKIGSTTEQAAADADKFAQQLVTVLQQRAEQHTQQVQQPLDQAKQLMGTGVNALRAAVNKAPRDTGPAARVAAASKQAEAAHLLRQASSIHRGHADLMKLMADNTAEGFPAQQAEIIRSLAEAAEHLADQAHADAVAALEQAGEVMGQAADAQRDESLAKSLREQSLSIYELLAQMTGVADWNVKADEVRVKLNPPAAPAEGVAPPEVAPVPEATPQPAPTEGEVTPMPEVAPETTPAEGETTPESEVAPETQEVQPAR